MTPPQNTQNISSANTIGDRNNQGIREYRVQKGIKIADIVRELGIPYRTLIAWETGYRKAAPYLIRLLKMYIDKMALEKDAGASERALLHEERLAESS